MQINKLYFLPIVILLITGSCSSEVKAPDTSDITVDFKVHRFEDTLYQINTTDVYMALDKLNNELPHFSKIYFTQILPLENKDNFETFHASIKNLTKDEAFKEIYNKVKAKYGDFSKYETELNQAFKFLKYYFPNYPTPDVYTFTSYFGYQSFIFEDGPQDGIGIGLDLFLGDQFDYKSLDPQNPMFSDYITQFFEGNFITKRIIEQIVDDKVGLVEGNKMIDHMIHQGKKLYMQKLLMPYHDESIIHEFTPEQMVWCDENESKIWSFFVDKELLYSTNVTEIKRYTDLAPTSRNMPAESPGRTGNYIGMKIIESYMKKYPETSLTQLISMTDGTTFLQNSGYKPPRL